MKRSHIDPAFLVILAGVSAALHVGKLPPALPVLREALGITLPQAGFLLSLVQLGGMTLGLAVGLAADGLGLKRSMVAGLLLLFAASALGGNARDAASLLALRGLEGFGFLLSTMPAPSLIQRLVPPHRMSFMLGLWGAYMPLGSGLALLCGPLVLASAGWPAWWRLLAALSLLMALWLWRAVPGARHAASASNPPDTAGASDTSDASNTPGITGAVNAANAADSPGVPSAPGAVDAAEPWPQRLRQTLRAPGPWLVALSFAVYSGQWLAVIGFLPFIYAQTGVTDGLAGVLTALAAVVNIGGNVASGRLLQRGIGPQTLLRIGFATMGLGAVVAFASVNGHGAPATLRYAAVLMFSCVGGMIPGTLFSLAVRLAPSQRTVSTTVGWMQQWSSIGQFVGPPLVGWLASRTGDWRWTWLITGACAALGLLLARQVGTLLARR